LLTAAAPPLNVCNATHVALQDCHKHANIAYDAKALKACLSDPTGPDGTVHADWETCAMVSRVGGFVLFAGRACARAGVPAYASLYRTVRLLVLVLRSGSV